MDSISTKLLKFCHEPICGPLTRLINTTIVLNQFRPRLKVAQVLPLFKKNDALNKVNFRPVSILPSISKAYERYYIINCRLNLRIFLTATLQPSEKVLVASLPRCDCLKTGRGPWTDMSVPLQYSWICPRLSTVYLMIFWLKRWGHMSPITRKPLLGVSDQVRLEPACTATEAS